MTSGRSSSKITTNAATATATSESLCVPSMPMPPARRPVAALVIVTEQMQQPVQRQHPQLVALGVADFRRLPPRDPARDHDVPKRTTKVIEFTNSRTPKVAEITNS